MPIYKIRLKKDDKVIVLSGKDKGKTGKVIKTHPKTNMLTVEGINIVKKHIKPSQTNKVGSIKEITKPIFVSKVAIIDPTTKKPSKIGYKINENGKKIRIYKTSGKEIV
ncbi:MAG: 50S ribosomal protein L24 [Patescibacteria group bacterium]|jgi:large subunit ribosomal protein L24|nr:50S ribosomal protein L24 [Patescibacteria group bacterium]